MKLKDLLKKLFPDNKEIDELELETETQTQIPSTSGDSKVVSELKNMIDTLKAENKKLFDAIAEANQKEANREKLLAEKAKLEAQEKVKNIINKAIEDKKIPAKDDKAISHFTKLLEADFDSGQFAINSLPPIVENKKPESNNVNDKKASNENNYKYDRQALYDALKEQYEATKN